MADKECNPNVPLDAMGLVEAINSENKWLTDVNRELLASAKFALSVLRSNGLFELSERLAEKKLVAAIALAESRS